MKSGNVLFAMVICVCATFLNVWLLTAAHVPHAELATLSSITLGNGRKLCSQYNLNLLRKSVERQQDVSWILGFASGHNYFRSVPKYKPLFSYYDAQNIVRQIDAECSKKPNELLVVVTYDFIRQLMMHPPKVK